jgi:mannosyltransferase
VTEQRSAAWTWTARGLGLAAAIALRVVALGGADLSTDEIQTLHAVRLPFGEMVDERLAAGHAPLYFVAEKAWCSLAGTSQFALRLPSVIFGLLLLVPAWSLFRRVAGERTAWWGAAILALHPLMIELSREARMYPLLLLAVLAAADAAAASLDGERPGARFWAAVALGPLVHPTWGIAVAPLLAWLAIERRGAAADARRASGLTLAGLAASAALLAAVLLVAVPQHQELTRRAWGREVAVFGLRLFTGSDLRVFHGVLPIVAVAGLWGAFVAAGFARSAPRARRLALWWALGAPLASVAVGVAGGVPWGPARYVQVAAVAFTLLAAAAAASIEKPRDTRAPLLLLLCVVSASYPIAAARTAWSTAAAQLAADPAPVVVDDESSRIVLAHYLGRDVHVGAPPAGAASWRRVSLDPASGGGRVRITAEPPPGGGPR